ncbi:MAG: hypothetical protein ACK5QT_08060 [Oligoflexia bacterium]|jgi:hypothetical protein
MTTHWKKCTTCKKSIAHRALYWVCNVSTCNRKRTGLTFCSVECWDAHVPVLRHKESWAEERRAPADGTEAPEPAKPRTQKTTETKTETPSPSPSVAPPLVIRRRQT